MALTEKNLASPETLSMRVPPEAWWEEVGKKRRPNLVQPISVYRKAGSIFLSKHCLSPSLSPSD